MTSLKTLLLLAFALSLPLLAWAEESSHTDSPDVQFSIVRTGGTETLEGFVYSGGSFTKKATISYVGVLLRHGDDSILFDTGLGSQIGTQYDADMPWWMRPFFKYDSKASPVRDQLAADELKKIKFIVLSHAHWDHASGVSDFPNLDIWLTAPELQFVHDSPGSVGGAWASQVGSATIHWKIINFESHAYEGFTSSHDVFGDGSVVLVPLYGHTPGSIGMFVTTASGKRFFFCGDAVWNAKAIDTISPKFLLARLLGDSDQAQTLQVITHLHELKKSDPSLVIVPAHDGELQKSLGFYPRWVR